MKSTNTVREGLRAPTIAEEMQVVNAPLWKRWIKERNKLTPINILDR
jgi:hypothetical protein